MKKVKLGEVGCVVTGNTPSTKDIENYSSKDICFIKPSDIYENEITEIINSEFYISEYARCKARILPQNSVLVTCIGIIGKVGVNANEVAFNQQINAIIPNKEKCNYKYLAYAILSAKEKLNCVANAPVVPIINKTQFSDFEISLPSLEEQKKIAERLDKVSSLIEKRKTQLTKLDQLIKSRFIEMFGDPSTNEKGWVIRDLENVTTVVTYGLTVRPEYISEGIDLVSARELHKGYIDYNAAPKISENDFAKLSEKGKPQKNDILFSKTGSIGHCALVTKEKPFAITQNAARIGLKAEDVNPLWLLYYLRMDYIQNWCKDHAKGNAVKDLQLQDMKVIPLFDCPLELQNQFAAFVEQTDRAKLAIQKSIDKLETLKKSLMQQYFG